MSSPSAPAREPYSAPALVAFGSVRNLTGGSNGNQPDTATPQNKGGNK